MSIKIYFLPFLVGFLILLLAACGDDYAGEEPSSQSEVTRESYVDFSHHEVNTPFGTVNCVYASGGRDGGLSCDWVGFHGVNGTG